MMVRQTDRERDRETNRQTDIQFSNRHMCISRVTGLQPTSSQDKIDSLEKIGSTIRFPLGRTFAIIGHCNNRHHHHNHHNHDHSHLDYNHYFPYRFFWFRICHYYVTASRSGFSLQISFERKMKCPSFTTDSSILILSTNAKTITITHYYYYRHYYHHSISLSHYY